MTKEKKSIRFSEDGSKYHFSCRFLPHDFQGKPSDNKIITQSEDSPFIVTENGLQPKPNLLGREKDKRQVGQRFEIGEIYIIHAIGTTLFKIGISSNFNRRFKDIAGCSPLPISVVRYGRCDNPHLLEKYFHQLFKDKRFKNEWFHLTKEDFEKIDERLDKYFERIPNNGSA
jgi:hypothetical protein